MFEGLIGVLAFFTTGLGLLGLAILLGKALVDRQPARARKLARFGLGWVLVYSLILVMVSLTSRPQTIPLGVERCYDEMCYSVKGVSTVPTLNTPSGPLAASGAYWVITLHLRSAAMRTAQRPSEPDLFLLDARGWRYRQSLLPDGEPVTAREVWDRPVAPGETLARTVAFDVPADAQLSGLVMSEGLGAISALVIGDENSLLHARTVFALEP